MRPTKSATNQLLMAQRALCPVWIGRDRPAAALALLQAHPECDIILSDDGLQHYRLRRDAEIVVIDGARRFGNGLLLPAGPLREPVSRLRRADCGRGQWRGGQQKRICHDLSGSLFYNLLNPGTILSAGEFAGQRLHAVAGIGIRNAFLRISNISG